MNFYALVEKAKENQKMTSDNQMAIKLGVSRSLISGWKSGLWSPDGLNTLKLIELADISATSALLIVTKDSENASLATSKTAANCILC